MTDRQDKSVLFCCPDLIYIALKSALRLRFFRGRDSPFFVAINQNLTERKLIA